MKKIPTPLVLTLGKPGTSTCFLVKIVSKSDGSAYGFTTLDANVRFNDQRHDLVYSATQELRPQNIQQEGTFETDNTQLAGWFDTALENLILAGNFDSGEVTIYRVAYLNLAAGAEVIAFGVMGEVDFSADNNGRRSVEFRGLTQLLQVHIVPLYSLTCRADFGDANCTMPFIWTPGTISAVADNPYTTFTISGVSEPDDFYVLGVINFLTGPNAGADLEIESWSSGGNVVLSFLAPYPVSVGDMVRIRQDCDKTATACKNYGNIINMRAEHLTPVQDKAVMVPGAYIKSTGAQ